MSIIIKDALWQPIDKMEMEENALASIREENNILIVAGPGAGKTELLAQKACYLLQTNKCPAPKKILAISFKKDSADNLQKRVEKRCGKELSNRFVSMTYDAFAKSILDRFRKGLPEEYLPNINYSIAVKDNISIKGAFAQYGNNLSDSIMNKILGNIKLPLKMQSDYEKVWKLLVKGNGVDIISTLNFQMISRLAEYILRTNPYILKALRLTYSHAFFDEFQDTTEIQYELVKTSFTDSDTNLTAVGDAKQRIMVWAGALQTVFNDYIQDFNGVEMQLLMNHRSAPKLVAIQGLMYKSLQDTPKKIECSPKWEENDGEVFLYKFKEYFTEAKIIANDIKRRNDEGVNLNDICILTKQKPQEYTEKIIEELGRMGIKARVEVDYQDLLKEPITILLLHSLYLITNDKCPDSWEYVNDFIYWTYQNVIENDSTIFDKRQKSLHTLLKKHREDLNHCEDIMFIKEVVQSILDFYGVANIKSIHPQYMQGTRFDNLVEKFIHFVWDEYIATESDWKLALENFQGLHSVPIMTIHKSKGLEYDAVYFVGLEDGAFWNFKKQPMEDRCAFFVALSRAKRSIAFTFSAVRTGSYPNQSKQSINEFFELLESVDYVNKIEM